MFLHSNRSTHLVSRKSWEVILPQLIILFYFSNNLLFTFNNFKRCIYLNACQLLNYSFGHTVAECEKNLLKCIIILTAKWIFSARQSIIQHLRTQIVNQVLKSSILTNGMTFTTDDEILPSSNFCLTLTKQFTLFFVLLTIYK